ncbi:unnamed protein product [Adineta steineri]|uniref:Uncharacterized protein n=1 Tax=Adineta steineri TaxID=433720 RepID=A0A814WCP9_9BILA|nr:unnamed protein product [Adineta steineri]CAF4109843.1 unnamed protein product [Adineta steineri]
MHILFCLLLFILRNHLITCVQPLFPPQIVFSGNDDEIVAIDEINQRAFITYSLNPPMKQIAYVMNHFPYAIPDSPESKYYVQLSNRSPMNLCTYGTYWKYGGNPFNYFPTHWANKNSFTIKNYINLDNNFIHSNDSSKDEDYWYTNVTCTVDSGEIYPCKEIYFQKNTDIPIRLTEVRHVAWSVIQVITNLTIITIGKPDDKYFDSIPKNWSIACRDINLGLTYNPTSAKIDLNKSVKIQVWLSSPPHRINGNDTVRIQWISKDCPDCFTFSPEQLYFNSQNFQEKQTLTITRVKKGLLISMIVPIFYGGGFDLVTPSSFPLYIQ